MSTLLTPATDTEIDSYNKSFSAEKKLLKPEIKKIKSAYKKTQVDKLVATGVNRKLAKKIVKSRMNHKLQLDDILCFDNGDTISVKEVLENSEKYNRLTLADPLEPEKGSNKAIFYANDKTGIPIIHSFAHGGINYSFALDIYKNFCKYHASGMIKGKHRVVKKENNKITFSIDTDLVKHNAGTNINGCNGKPVNIAQYWNNDRYRKKFEGVKFLPISGMMQSRALVVDKDGVLNLYTGMATEPIKGTCDLILWHILHIWCNGDKELNEYTLNWFARMLQHPEDRAHTALVLSSDQGAGKGLVTDMMDRGFGQHGVTFTDGNKLTGKFNSQLGSSVFICANEATYGGDKKEAGIIKGIITDETLNVEYKYVDAVEVNNCVHLVVLTNNSWSMPQDIGDRRLVSYDVSSEKIGDKAYFDALRHEINNGGENAFFYYLMHRDISNFKPQDMPACMTETERQNKLRSAGSIVQWFSHILTDGAITVKGVHTDVTLAMIDKPEPANDETKEWEKSIQISKPVLYETYLRWCRDHSLRPDGNEAFGKQLPKFGVKSGRKQRNGRRVNVYNLPSHADCVTNLEELLVG